MLPYLDEMLFNFAMPVNNLGCLLKTDFTCFQRVQLDRFGGEVHISVIFKTFQMPLMQLVPDSTEKYCPRSGPFATNTRCLCCSAWCTWNSSFYPLWTEKPQCNMNSYQESSAINSTPSWRDFSGLLMEKTTWWCARRYSVLAQYVLWPYVPRAPICTLDGNLPWHRDPISDQSTIWPWKVFSSWVQNE